MAKVFGTSMQMLTDDTVRQQILIGAITIAVAGGCIVYLGETAIGALYVLCFALGAGLFAYSCPIATTALWALLALYGRQLLGPVSLAGQVDARITDPVLLGIVVALGLAVLAGDDRIRRTFFGPCLLWTVLVTWIGFEFFRSIPSHGAVQAIGELRTSFQAIFVVPYIVVFVRTPDQQRRLFKVLALLAGVFVAAALINGALAHGFAISRSTRWMVAQVNLALILCIGGWFVARRTGFWTNATIPFLALLTATLVLVIVCNHRSVWMVSAGLMVCFALFRLISIGRVVALVTGLVISIAALDLLTRDVDVLEFIRTRMGAFTSFREDSTASWRADVWSVAIEQARAHPFFGKGFGNYFYLELPDGRIVTSILHNLYIQIGLQLGLVGLLLYLAFVIGTLKILWRTYRDAPDVHSYTLSVCGIVALVGGTMFYMAYGFDPVTWLFVGLGLAAALTHSISDASEQARVRRGSPRAHVYETGRVQRQGEPVRLSPRGKRPV